ncbi:type II toxin-antitoxin system RelE/ParE family toxin [Algoriphagus chordae]|uniref:Toxin YoeB n=1 Tax=Algoriphagus chordae TaxID=237019 RepID=A0A2W7RC20_9BACT|nr:type II toxin-antitoxin system RelE/ParE family toxin [Algoriphagus chordae]PZX55850.1 toxin YoeB [Algoriphagus chordae]
MVKKVVWTLRAEQDRKEILSYWKKRNKSNTYSIKLNGLFKEAVKIIQSNPHIGKLTNSGNVRSKIVKDYLMFYEEFPEELVILAIWDNRRNPKNQEYISSF